MEYLKKPDTEQKKTKKSKKHKKDKKDKVSNKSKPIKKPSKCLPIIKANTFKPNGIEVKPVVIEEPLLVSELVN